MTRWLVTQSLIECLELAAVEGHRIVAVPALGTGGLNYPPEKVANATAAAVALHNLQYPNTSIQTVNIVLWNDDAELIKAYIRMCAASSTNVNDDQDNMTGPDSQTYSPGGKQPSATGAKSTAPQKTKARSNPPPTPGPQNNAAGRSSMFSRLMLSVAKIGYTHQLPGKHRPPTKVLHTIPSCAISSSSFHAFSASVSLLHFILGLSLTVRPCG
ncbi:poly [ADP-ribose] polymerase [Elysia marginata]|uniref:Poly [ADP-ribose] polymerase n=1 Tax=Elysia marginata TaxID=1093978 RepID=A0AAV4EBV1_9GAST|nr:poly [ADP-ribose] polymerase [Elysia marginata]